VSCVPQQLIQPRSQVTGRRAISAALFYRVLLRQAAFCCGARWVCMCLPRWQLS